MKRIVAGGTGLVGTRIINDWLDQGHEVTVIGRSLDKIKSNFGNRVQALSWKEISTENDLFSEVDVILNLTGANISEGRWTTSRKKEILESRVNSTRILLDKCSQVPNPNLTFLNASAVGIYGTQSPTPEGLPPALTEESPLPSPFPDYLSMVCATWEKEVESKTISCKKTVCLRFGVIFNQKGGAYPKMVLPFKLFAGGPVGSGKQPIPWVSLEDLSRAVQFILEKPELKGPINIVSPGCLTQNEFAKLVGTHYRRPSFIPTPGFVLKLVLGQVAEEIILAGAHIAPQKLLNNKFEFTHPNLSSFLESLND